MLKNRDSLRGKMFPQDMLDLAEPTESCYEVMKKIVDLGQDKDGLFFQVQWEGLHDKRDYTCQPVKELHGHVLDLVTAFLESLKKTKKLFATSRHSFPSLQCPLRPFAVVGAVRPADAPRRLHQSNGNNTAQSYGPILRFRSIDISYLSVCLSNRILFCKFC